MTKQIDRKFAARRRGGSRGAAAQVRWLAFVSLVVVAAGSWFYWRQNQSRVAETVETAAPGVVLSEITTKILAGLETPIDLRLFAPADGSILSAALGGYLTRVESLLAEYERVAAGKVRLIKCDPQTDAGAKAAAGAAGVVPFASESGEIVYLGLTVGTGARSESIAPLAPEWEAALESDVSRAIQRVTAARVTALRPAAQTPAPPAPIDPAISEELLRTIPDLESRSFEDAAKTLRESALAEFTVAVREMQTKVQATEQQLAAAPGNKSEADQQAALKQLQQVQAEEGKKLAEITARLQVRLKVLERLKGANRPLSK